jgi:chemotaxis protein histidine kinase CheA
MAQNCRVVLLTGTPIINYPNEIGILFNILRGYIKKWNFTLDTKVSNFSKDTLQNIFSKEKVLDYVNYVPSSKTLTITRNPYGFENKITNAGYKGVTNEKKPKKDESGKIEKDENGKTIYVERGIMSDETFVKRTVALLKNNDITAIEKGTSVNVYTALPDTLEEFINMFINSGTGVITNVDKFKRRIIGLTSYFRSAQEELLPAYNKDRDRHVIEIPMSDYQFVKYEEYRKEERLSEKNSKTKKPVGIVNQDGIFKEPSSTYRIFSRLACNFVMPTPPGRPNPADYRIIDATKKINNILNWLKERHFKDREAVDSDFKQKYDEFISELSKEFIEQNEKNIKHMLDLYTIEYLKNNNREPIKEYAIRIGFDTSEQKAEEKAEQQEVTVKKVVKKIMTEEQYAKLKEKEAKLREKEEKDKLKAEEKQRKDEEKQKKADEKADKERQKAEEKQKKAEEKAEKERQKAEEKAEKERQKAEEKQKKEEEKAEKREVKDMFAEEKDIRKRLKELQKKKKKDIVGGNIDDEDDQDDTTDEDNDTENDQDDTDIEDEDDTETEYSGGSKIANAENFIDNQDDDAVLGERLAEYKDEDAILREADELEGDEILETMGSIEYKEAIKSALRYLQIHSQEFLSLEGLKTYSPKFLTMIENIEDPEHKGLHLIYSQFRSMEGIGIFCLALDANGFARFKIKRNGINGWQIDMSEEDMGKPCYALYTGTEDAEEKEIIRNIYNGTWDYIPNNIASQLRAKSSNNNLGEIIKILMITSAGSEGINLRNTRYVHIMEPYWHPVRLEQVVGRARRICSHQSLPKELQTVEVFIYIMKFTEQQLQSEIAKELRLKDRSRNEPFPIQTSDEKLFEILSIKEELTGQLLTAVKETAIDCATHIKSSSKEGLVCLSFGQPKIDDFSFNPSISQDQNDTIANINKNVKDWQAIPFVMKTTGKRYMLREDTKQVYDYDSVIRAKQIPGVNPILLGKLVKNNNGKLEIVKEVI